MKIPGGLLDFSGPALVMAIVNCNSDSFYAPSRALYEQAVEKALLAEKDGAAIIDFGAESTRPGSVYIGEEEEFERLIPVVAAFRKRSSLPVSVDTRKANIALAALRAGADIVNDVSALNDDPRMAEVCAASGAAVILMHNRPLPASGDLVSAAGLCLKSAADKAIAAGIPSGQIIIDPGIGFMKNPVQNILILSYLKRLAEIAGKDYPVLVGLSRKRFIGEITGRDAENRLAGTLAANGAAILYGAKIIRVHDVKEHIDLVKTLFALTGTY